MSEETLKATIKDLEAKAMEAYKARNFDLENEYDRRLKTLRDQLASIPEVPVTEAALIPHHWNQENIRAFGNDRCRRCQMQYRYYNEGMAMLKDWPEKQKATREFNEQMRKYNCRA